MTPLNERLEEIRSHLGSAELVAVTKTVSDAIARQAFELGVHDLAENRPQQLWQKQLAIPEARWHLIGPLQRNKIEKTVPLCTLIHSVDSLKLLTALNDHGLKNQRKVNVLLQVNCSREAAKGGFAVEELPSLAEQLPALQALNIEGLMTMAADQDAELCRGTFAELRQIRDDLQTRTGLVFKHLSMGMSNDYEVAVQEGATLVRIGSALFQGLS